MATDGGGHLAAVPAVHRPLLTALVDRLVDEWVGVYGPDLVAECVVSSFHHFADQATLPTYLPLLIERFARERLDALAHALPGATPPAVLYLCTHNAGRSQMAMGWTRALGGDRIVAWSAGQRPAAAVDPAVVAAMAEVGIDLAEAYPKPWTDEVLGGADVVVHIGVGNASPVFPGRAYREWALADPERGNLEQARAARDRLEGLVQELLDDLGVQAGPGRAENVVAPGRSTRVGTASLGTVLPRP